jgi:hypothetical protein
VAFGAETLAETLAAETLAAETFAGGRAFSESSVSRLAGAAVFTFAI